MVQVYSTILNIDKEKFEPGGTLEERVSVLEEVMQEQVMSTTNEDEGATR